MRKIIILLIVFLCLQPLLGQSFTRTEQKENMNKVDGLLNLKWGDSILEVKKKGKSWDLICENPIPMRYDIIIMKGLNIPRDNYPPMFLNFYFEKGELVAIDIVGPPSVAKQFCEHEKCFGGTLAIADKIEYSQEVIYYVWKGKTTILYIIDTQDSDAKKNCVKRIIKNKPSLGVWRIVPKKIKLRLKSIK